MTGINLLLRFCLNRGDCECDASSFFSHLTQQNTGTCSLDFNPFCCSVVSSDILIFEFLKADGETQRLSVLPAPGKDRLSCCNISDILGHLIGQFRRAAD